MATHAYPSSRRFKFAASAAKVSNVLSRADTSFDDAASRPRPKALSDGPDDDDDDDDDGEFFTGAGAEPEYRGAAGQSPVIRRQASLKTQVLDYGDSYATQALRDAAASPAPGQGAVASGHKASRGKGHDKKHGESESHMSISTHQSTVERQMHDILEAVDDVYSPDELILSPTAQVLEARAALNGRSASKDVPQDACSRAQAILKKVCVASAGDDLEEADPDTGGGGDAGAAEQASDDEVSPVDTFQHKRRNALPTGNFEDLLAGHVEELPEHTCIADALEHGKARIDALLGTLRTQRRADTIEALHGWFRSHAALAKQDMDFLNAAEARHKSDPKFDDQLAEVETSLGDGDRKNLHAKVEQFRKELTEKLIENNIFGKSAGSLQQAQNRLDKAEEYHADVERLQNVKNNSHQLREKLLLLDREDEEKDFQVQQEADKQFEKLKADADRLRQQVRDIKDESVTTELTRRRLEAVVHRATVGVGEEEASIEAIHQDESLVDIVSAAKERVRMLHLEKLQELQPTIAQANLRELTDREAAEGHELRCRDARAEVDDLLLILGVDNEPDADIDWKDVEARLAKTIPDFELTADGTLDAHQSESMAAEASDLTGALDGLRAEISRLGECQTNCNQSVYRMREARVRLERLMISTLQEMEYEDMRHDETPSKSHWPQRDLATFWHRKLQASLQTAARDPVLHARFLWPEYVVAAQGDAGHAGSHPPSAHPASPQAFRPRSPSVRVRTEVGPSPSRSPAGAKHLGLPALSAVVHAVKKIGAHPSSSPSTVTAHSARLPARPMQFKQVDKLELDDLDASLEGLWDQVQGTEHELRDLGFDCFGQKMLAGGVKKIAGAGPDAPDIGRAVTDPGPDLSHIWRPDAPGIGRAITDAHPGSDPSGDAEDDSDLEDLAPMVDLNAHLASEAVALEEEIRLWQKARVIEVTLPSVGQDGPGKKEATSERPRSSVTLAEIRSAAVRLADEATMPGRRPSVAMDRSALGSFFSDTVDQAPIRRRQSLGMLALRVGATEDAAKRRASAIAPSPAGFGLQGSVPSSEQGAADIGTLASRWHTPPDLEETAQPQPTDEP